MSSSNVSLYCMRDGIIKSVVPGEVPQGALRLIGGDAQDLWEIVQGTARLAYDNETYLVPGVPEATDSERALDAVVKYQGILEQRIRDRYRANPEHIDKMDWSTKFQYGLGGKPIFSAYGWKYYCGVGHDDGECQKLEHPVINDQGLVIWAPGPSYQPWTYAEFRKWVEEQRVSTASS